MNPMLDILSRQAPAAASPMGRISQIFNTARALANPMQVLSQMYNQTQIGQVQDLVHKYGGNAQQAFYDLAKQKGVNPNDILNMLR